MFGRKRPPTPNEIARAKFLELFHKNMQTPELQSLTGELDTYLAAIGQIAAAYDEFLDFSIPSALTRGKEGTYDGSHYSRATNARVLAGLMANESDVALDWRKEDLAAITALYHKRLAEFMGTITEAQASPKR